MTNTARIKGLIFDLDGVLADTISLHYQAWKHLADLEGVLFTQADMDTFRGRSRYDCLNLLFKDITLSKERIEHYALLKDDLYLQALQQTPREDLILPGVEATIAEAKKRSLKLGVASASANAIPVLQYTRLDIHMDVIADGLTVVRPKPHPDIFVWTAGALGIRPREAVVFEDSLAGIRAAQAAGMLVVGLGTPDTIKKAGYGVPSMDQLNMDDLLGQVAQEST